MADLSCPRETELLDALAHGQQPDEDLAAHLTSCAACTELHAVAGAIFDDASMAMREAPIPSSGGVWWRIERRVREEAALTATRTVSVVQIATVVAAAALAILLLGGLPAIAMWIGNLDLPLPAKSGSTFWTLPLIFGIATFLLLAPVAIYFAVTEE